MAIKVYYKNSKIRFTALEHLNFLCIGLGRREDFGQQGRKRWQCYSLPSISNAAGHSRSRHKPYTKNLIALTLPEMIIALSIMAVLMAVVLPQFRLIQKSWDSRQYSSDTLQNGRVLTDHIFRNLTKAAKITAVSDSTETNGYVEFEDIDGTVLRYDIAANNYVQYGDVGNLSDLAGPVSKLQFACYALDDLDTPITDIESIRFVQVDTTMTNQNALASDRDFTTKAFLRANSSTSAEIVKESSYEFDTSTGKDPALAQIDSTHYLCAYEGSSDDGWAVILTVNPVNWAITKGTPFEFDNKNGETPALVKIDSTHYLCAYEGDKSDGWAVVLVVDTSSGTVTKKTPFEFDNKKGKTSALAQIDSANYLCTYAGNGDDGWATILTVNAGTWAIAKGTSYEFDNKKGKTPALAQIDSTHYLCSYTGDNDDGWATVLTVNTGSKTVSKESSYEYDTVKGKTPALAQIDSTHYLCTYAGNGDDGWATILTVNPSSWAITKGTPFEFDNEDGKTPALAKISSTNYLCTYEGDNDDGWAKILVVNTGSSTVTETASLEFDTLNGETPALLQIDTTHFLCTYSGNGDDGWSVVLTAGQGAAIGP